MLLDAGHDRPRRTNRKLLAGDLEDQRKVGALGHLPLAFSTRVGVHQGDILQGQVLAWGCDAWQEEASGCDEHRLGRLDADHPAEARGDVVTADAEEPRMAIPTA